MVRLLVYGGLIFHMHHLWREEDTLLLQLSRPSSRSKRAGACTRTSCDGRRCRRAAGLKRLLWNLWGPAGRPWYVLTPARHPRCRGVAAADLKWMGNTATEVCAEPACCLKDTFLFHYVKLLMLEHVPQRTRFLSYIVYFYDMCNIFLTCNIIKIILKMMI
jgi:hypothetical protein